METEPGWCTKERENRERWISRAEREIVIVVVLRWVEAPVEDGGCELKRRRVTKRVYIMAVHGGPDSDSRRRQFLSSPSVLFICFVYG
jgi:hypothetical protein